MVIVLIIVTFINFCASLLSASQDPLLLAQIKFDRSEMIVISKQEWLKEGLDLPDIAHAIEAYHQTQPFRQSLQDFLDSPDGYFSLRLGALNQLLYVLSKAGHPHPLLKKLTQQAVSKKLYIEALPSMQEPYTTKPEAIPTLKRKLLKLNDHYMIEKLDPLHRAGQGAVITRKRWEASSIPNYFIFLDTVENDALLETFTNTYQVTYSYEEKERGQHLLFFEDGKAYFSDGTLFDTTEYHAAHSGKGFSIFVIGEDQNFYVNHHHDQGIHHSSEFAGQDIIGAGEIYAEKGVIRCISNKSGHYRPNKENMLVSLSLLCSKIGSLKDIEALLSSTDGHSFFTVVYAAQAFLETNGHCLPLPSKDYSLLEIALIEDLIEYADDVICEKSLEGGEERIAPLLFAANEGRAAWIKLLLAHQACTSQTDSNGKTALETASARGYLDCVSLLYDATHDTDIRKKAFFESSRSGDLKVFDYFRQQQHSLEQVDDKGNTLFHFASMAPNPALLRYLLSESLCYSPFATNRQGDSPLHAAASHGCIENVSLLMELGLDIFTQNSNGDTALHLAAKTNSDEMSRFLLQWAPQDLFSIKNKEGSLPLHYAAEHLSGDLFQEYLAKTGPVDVRDNQGESPLFYTLRQRHSNAWINFCLLLKNHTDLTQTNNEGYSFFHKAASIDSWMILLALTYHDGLLLTTAEGNTPLHIAFYFKSLSTIQYLLRFYSQEALLLKNAEGKNIFDLALELGDQDILNQLTQSKLLRTCSKSFK